MDYSEAQRDFLWLGSGSRVWLYVSQLSLMEVKLSCSLDVLVCLSRWHGSQSLVWTDRNNSSFGREVGWCSEGMSPTLQSKYRVRVPPMEVIWDRRVPLHPSLLGSPCLTRALLSFMVRGHSSPLDHRGSLPTLTPPSASTLVSMDLGLSHWRILRESGQPSMMVR